MSKNAKWIIAILVIILIVVGVWYYNTKSSNITVETSPIRIGALFPLTGGLATYGQPAQKVAVIAAEEINNQGGINGRKVEIDYQDHQCKPPVALTLFQQLSSLNGIKIFTSVACSGTVSSIAPQLGDDSVLLGTLTSAANLTGISPAFFRNYASDADGSRLFAEYIVNNKDKKVATIYEETDYAKGLKVFMEKDLEGKGVVVISEGFVPDSTDVRSQLTKLKASNPDVLFVSPQTVTTADKILKQMRELAFRPKVLLVNENVFKGEDLLKNYPDILEGAISVGYVLPNNSKSQHVLDAYKAKYGEDCPQKNVCLGVYDNIYLLAEAAAKNNDDVAKIKDYLKNVNYDGASGAISFDANNDRDNARYTLFIIKGGKGVELK